MKALIIYDDFAKTVEANAALQQSAWYSDISVQWNITLWRVDMLKWPPAAETALTEAIDAHLIVFVGRCAQSPPLWLEHWLEHWAKCRQIENAALAVYCEGSSDALLLPVSLELSRFAMRHGLTVLFDDENVSRLPTEVEPTVSGHHIDEAHNKVEGKVTRRETARPANTRCSCREPSVLRACSSCPSRLRCSCPPVIGESRRFSP
jgi:hypothetical protein